MLMFCATNLQMCTPLQYRLLLYLTILLGIDRHCVMHGHILIIDRRIKVSKGKEV
jgi:hypothetical protein